jgi:hypothetical protein
MATVVKLKKKARISPGFINNALILKFQSLQLTKPLVSGLAKLGLIKTSS